MTAASYDPGYDPLVDRTPGAGRDYAPTYWVATAGAPPATDAPVDGDKDVDVAIIGSGFTGLATALFLAENQGIKSCVLEANAVAWGCTSRNGGQGQFACGRLKRGQWVKKWGEDVAVRLHEDVRDGFEHFRSLTRRIDCDPQGDGHLLVAHRESLFDAFSGESELNRRVFNYRTEVLSAGELKDRYVDEKRAFGALYEPEGIGVHPLKLAFGYLKMARELGVAVHPSSPITEWRTERKKHKLHTPGGVVTARKVVVCSGGYTHASLNPMLAYRYMPILSNSVVTRPLSDQERESCGLKTHLVMTDTRYLRFYYRLLPDNRVQIGTRSAITGKDATNKKHYRLLVDGLHAKFPSLKSVGIEYSWWGWVDVSHDMMPRIFCADAKNGNSVFYALGYGGNGVAFSAHAGVRLAELIVDKKMPDLPIYSSELPRHLFTPFRRIGQRMFYVYYHALDLLP